MKIVVMAFLTACGIVGASFVVLVALLGQLWIKQSLPLVADPMEATTVVQAARSLQARIWGPHANTYNPYDPLMARVMGYWKTYCSDGKGGLCKAARSGSLQCVEIATAAYWLAGDPLPVLGNAEDFRFVRQSHAMGTASIPKQFPWRCLLAPLPGDLMVWKGGGFFQAGRYGLDISPSWCLIFLHLEATMAP